MKRRQSLFLAALLITLLSSCGSFKNYTYTSVDSLDQLDGIYLDTEVIGSAFNRPFPYDSIDIYKLDFEDKKILNLWALTPEGYKLIKSYKGKYNDKKNYFQVKLGGTFAPFLIVHRVSSDVVRMGADSLGNLFVDKRYYGYGGMIIFYGGYDYQISRTPIPGAHLQAIPTQVAGKWGFADRDGNMIIKPVYDFVRTFRDSLARVIVNGKWGLIDNVGNELCPPIYDRINPSKVDSLYYIRLADRTGMINRNGKILVPPIYDGISIPVTSSPHIFVIGLNGKKGFYENGTEILPPLADHISHSPENSERFSRKLLDYTLTIKKREYVMDRQGRLYRILAKEQKFLDSFLSKPLEYYLDEPVSYEELLDNK